MGHINVFGGHSNSCGCCPPTDGYCTPPSCASCITDDGMLRPHYSIRIPGAVGIPDGLDCYMGCGVISYYTHQCMSIASGQWLENPSFESSASGILYTCASSIPYYNEIPCTGNQYVNILVTVAEFSPGGRPCKVGGSTYGLINPAYNHSENFPFFGGTDFIIPGGMAQSGRGGLSPCAKNITDINVPGFLYEHGTRCRWEWGGADYMFYDNSDDGKLKRCVTGTGCNDCEVKQSPGVFGGQGHLPAWFSYFIIVFDAAFYPINASPDYIYHPQVTISVGNMLIPTYDGWTGLTSLVCRPIGQSYSPAWRINPSGLYLQGSPSGKYMNCNGPTTFYRDYTHDGYGPPGQINTYGFPDSVEVEVG